MCVPIQVRKKGVMHKIQFLFIFVVCQMHICIYNYVSRNGFVLCVYIYIVL